VSQYTPTVLPKPQTIACPKIHSVYQNTNTIVHKDGKCTVNCPQCNTCYYVDTNLISNVEQSDSEYLFSGTPLNPQHKNYYTACIWARICRQMDMSQADSIAFGNTWLQLDISKREEQAKREDVSEDTFKSKMESFRAPKTSSS
jgi:hypothetical protein